jgi:hypothetical protein
MTMDYKHHSRQVWMAAAIVLVSVLTPVAAHAVGNLADISVVDRNTGQTLPVYFHQGRHWVAGQPGSRYAVRIHNRSGGRLLSVTSIDGVNVISGETAATSQSAYVFSPWERHDLTGWRKSAAQVASFYFTALPDSYAARTGRPDDVGVIGVALFRERQPEVSAVLPRPQPYGRRDGSPMETEKRARSEMPAAPSSADGAGASRSAPAGVAADAAAPPMRAQAESKLGTGHGQRETSQVTYTSFQRAQETPDEVVTIHYDSRVNLLAMGIVTEPRLQPRPRPFPTQPEIGFVPDPPRH